jgi:hypothetical protein
VNARLEFDMATARVAAALVSILACCLGIVVQIIEPWPDDLPMFLHHAMSFDARREFLEYGCASGHRTTPAAQRSLSARLRLVP